MAPPSLLAHLDAAKDTTTLSLAYASIGDDGCNAIARFMRENVVLRSIDLRGNNIRADGLIVLSQALRTSSTIVSLCLKWNHVGSHDRGIQALCEVLKQNQSITHLDLRNNKIGPDAARHLGEMLRDNKTLTHLDISWNELGPEGGKELVKGIQANPSLLDCQLAGNRIADDTLHAIAFVLRRNRQTAPLSAAIQAESPPGSPGTRLPRIAGAAGPLSPQPVSPVSPARSDVSGGRFNQVLGTTRPAPVVHDEGLSLKLLQKEQNNSNAEEARFFGEVAEYIDLLQLDAARNKKYRLDAEERERIVTKGFMEREMRYAQEMRELETLLAKAKAAKDELLHDTQYLQTEIERVRDEKAKTIQDKERCEDVFNTTADRLRSDIRDSIALKADLETQIYKTKRRQEEQEEENARLRTYLCKCKEDLDRALR